MQISKFIQHDLSCVIWNHINLVHIMVTSSKYGAQSRLHVRSNLQCYIYVIVSKRVSDSGQLPSDAELYRGLSYTNCLLTHSLPCNELLNVKTLHSLSALATWHVSSSTSICNLKFSKSGIHYICLFLNKDPRWKSWKYSTILNRIFSERTKLKIVMNVTKHAK